VGTQYRSIILYTSDAQKAEAQKFIDELKTAGVFAVTELAPLAEFTEAEEYHKDYYAKNSRAPYCQIFIAPKIEKLEKRFAELMKEAGN